MSVGWLRLVDRGDANQWQRREARSLVCVSKTSSAPYRLTFRCSNASVVSVSLAGTHGNRDIKLLKNRDDRAKPHEFKLQRLFETQRARNRDWSPTSAALDVHCTWKNSQMRNYILLKISTFPRRFHLEVYLLANWAKNFSSEHSYPFLFKCSNRAL